MSNPRPPPRGFAAAFEFPNHFPYQNLSQLSPAFSSAKSFPPRIFKLRSLRYPAFITCPVSFSIIGASALLFTHSFSCVSSHSSRSCISRLYPGLSLFPIVSSPHWAVTRLATSLYGRLPRFPAMASVRPDCRPSKTFVSSLRSFRQAPYSFRAVRTVAFAFHSVFLWIMFVCRLRYVRVFPESGSQLETRAFRRLTPEGTSEEGTQQSKSAVTSLRPPVRDVPSRRALAYKLQSVKKINEDVSCWQTHLFLNSRRQTLFTQSWILANERNMKGVLVLLHGLNEHSGRYVNFAEQLNARGYGVYAMDWIGHGGSDGLHGYVASLDHVVADTKAFLHWVKDRNPGVPCFLFGHSTGGAVVLKAALHPSVEAMLEGVILTSPAIRVRPAHPVFGVIAPFFSILVPTLQFKGANKRGIPVTRDPAELVAKYSDPLVYVGPIRIRTGSEILRITAYLQKHMTGITVPFFVLHGNADTVTDPLASQDLYKFAVSKHKRLKLYDGCLHDLLFDLEREEITNDILRWMDERLSIC